MVKKSDLQSNMQEPSLPQDYQKTITELTNLIYQARQKVVRVVNRSLIELYWKIGDTIVQKQKNSGWGEEVIEYLALDLQSRFPDMKGLSPRNLWRHRC